MIEQFKRLGESQVIGAEVVSPLTQTVGLVDRDEGDRDLLQRADELAAAKTFGRDVDKFKLSRLKIAEKSRQIGWTWATGATKRASTR
jgi:hypothetical protein